MKEGKLHKYVLEREPEAPPEVSIRIRYSIPGRQLLLIFSALIFVMGGVIAGYALKIAALPLTLMIAVPGCFIVWALTRHIHGDGDATMGEDELIIIPRRRAFCGTLGRVSIPWNSIKDAITGVTETEPGREYVIVKTRRPSRTWMMSAHDPEYVGFPGQILARANVARGPDTPLLDGVDAMNSPAWKLVAIGGLVVFFGGIALAFLTGRADRWGVWLNLAFVGCAFIPLAFIVFRSRDH
jgi:hypothetical protein